ncbi:hypothetical protein NL676_038252 [Syzygium grande]|nr:hypothetical protein NL676_038252 [Syzygium grande]
MFCTRLGPRSEGLFDPTTWVSPKLSNDYSRVKEIRGQRCMITVVIWTGYLPMDAVIFQRPNAASGSPIGRVMNCSARVSVVTEGRATIERDANHLPAHDDSLMVASVSRLLFFLESYPLLARQKGPLLEGTATRVFTTCL